MFPEVSCATEITQKFPQFRCRTCMCATSAEHGQATFARVFIFLLHERPSTRNEKLQSQLANACDKILVDTLAALLQGGVPVMYNSHVFGPQLAGYAMLTPSVHDMLDICIPA